MIKETTVETPSKLITEFEKELIDYEDKQLTLKHNYKVFMLAEDGTKLISPAYDSVYPCFTLFNRYVGLCEYTFEGGEVYLVEYSDTEYDIIKHSFC